MPATKTTSRNWLFWTTLFVLFCAGVYVLRSVLMPFVAGIIIAYLLDPWVTKFKKWDSTAQLAHCWFCFWS